MFFVQSRTIYLNCKIVLFKWGKEKLLQGRWRPSWISLKIKSHCKTNTLVARSAFLVWTSFDSGEVLNINYKDSNNINVLASELNWEGGELIPTTPDRLHSLETACSIQIKADNYSSLRRYSQLMFKDERERRSTGLSILRFQK